MTKLLPPNQNMATHAVAPGDLKYLTGDDKWLPPIKAQLTRQQ
jgi:hypothetical protein